MARYRYPLAVSAKRDPAGNIIGHLYSHAAFIIPPIEQTKERLVVTRQQTVNDVRSTRLPAFVSGYSGPFLIFRRWCQ